MELFYHEQIDNQTKVFKLEGKEHIHIKKVLRKKEGQIVKFTNGNSYCFSAKIISILEKESNFEIISKTKFDAPSFLHIGISLLFHCPLLVSVMSRTEEATFASLKNIS